MFVFLRCDWLRRLGADQRLSADLSAGSELEAQRGLSSVLTGSQHSTARPANGLLPADRPAVTARPSAALPPVNVRLSVVSSDEKAEQLADCGA